VRIAVTGAGGGLGRAFLARAGREHDVVPFTHVELPIDDQRAVEQRIREARPDLILNLAAMTSVDACELDPVAAFRANALGARHVAMAASWARALVVHVSTDYVFDGAKGEPYHEFDEPAPISAYGRSKLAGEREVATHAGEHLIVRTSWVFGGGKDFLTSALGRLREGETVPAITDLTSTPTYVGHLADRVLPAAEAGLRGVVHLGGPEPSSWFDLLSRTASRLSLRGEVVAQKSDELGRPAPRPVYSALTSLVVPGSGLEPMPPLDEAIDEILGGDRGLG